MEKSFNYIKWGILLMVIPPLIILGTLVGFALINTVMADPNETSATLSVLNMVMGLLGFVGTLGVVIGGPTGLVFLILGLTKKSEAKQNA